jgi:hypothetical protein
MASNRTVEYIDFGYDSAGQFWSEVVLSAYERFRSTPNRQHAIEASVPAWHVHEWIWHERHPGEDTRNNSDFAKFLTDILKACPELAWVRDVADAGKHRGLGRKNREVLQVEKNVRHIGPLNTYACNTMALNSSRSTATLTVVLNDGSKHSFAKALSSAINYWQENFFAPNE